MLVWHDLPTCRFGEVVGIDYSQAFVDAATEMQKGEPVPFSIPTEVLRIHTSG